MKTTVERTFQGAIRLSTIVNGLRISQQYMGYSLTEAKRKFLDHVNGMLTHPPVNTH